MMLLNVGDLVQAVNYIGIYRIHSFSEHGVIAEIESYDVAKGIATGKRVSVPVTILRPVQPHDHLAMGANHR
jgi:hypothetical protein